MMEKLSLDSKKITDMELALRHLPRLESSVYSLRQDVLATSCVVNESREI